MARARAAAFAVKVGRKRPADMASAEHPPSPVSSFAYRLNTVAGVRREICRLYRQARGGSIAVADASRLGNLLFLAARLLEGQELEARVQALEAADQQRKERLRR